MILQTFKPGQSIFLEGHGGDAAFLVESGTVEISRTVDGEKMVLGRIGSGGLFGEMALIDGKPRMADAHAVEVTKLFLVPTTVFRSQLETSDPFMRKLVMALINHTRSLSDQLAEYNQRLQAASKAQFYTPTTSKR